ncbi:MAG TPA: endo-alpha-N-acetylgalactosaminidase family protein [Candidatus Brocadiia bacterium]|nr:endo-alpha-N-acetylgalactosaminidase family protein [Candidatus Brocadiia bacterium]
MERIELTVDRKVLNPVLEGDVRGKLTLKAIYPDGAQRVLQPSEAVISARTRSASGNADVVTIEGDTIIPKEGGIATIEAAVVQDGRTLKAATDVIVRPFYRDYHQTLVMKLFLGMEGDPVERLAGEQLFKKKHDVICTFEEALEVIRRADNLTRGIPKIVYLVGWQKGGHDHGYPSWSEVNPRLKRAQDATALDSLRWLIREARQFNTTVSLHINMVDAYRQSPLWDEYVAKDCFARDEKGDLLVAGIQVKDEEMYNVVYPREWEAGLAQRRIDELIRMIPELKEGHTIHVDVFIAQRENGKPISPWHAKPENGGLIPEKYVETQRRIFHYWRERGFDVTGEGIFWAHPAGEGFTGLQAMSWWYPGDPGYQMQIPERLMARGRTDRGGDGDFRFGASMHGEEIWQKDKDNMPGFLGMFCRTTLPWHYLSRLERVKFEKETLYYNDGVIARIENGRKIIRKGDFVLREDDDLFVPALWNEKEIIAYSRSGCRDKAWLLPDDWRDVKGVDISRITMEGLRLLKRDVTVIDRKLSLSLDADEAVSITPARGHASTEAGRDSQRATAHVLNLKDFGAAADSGIDATPAFQMALAEAARHAGGVTIRLSAGRYDFFPEKASRRTCYASNCTEPHSDGMRTIAIDIRGLRNLIIDGRGALLMMRGKMTMLAAEDCENLTIRDLTFDFQRPTMSELTIKEKGGKYALCEIHPDSKYRIENGNRLIWVGEGWENRDLGAVQYYDPVRLRTWRTGNPLEGADRISEQQPGLVRFEWDKRKGDLPRAGTVLQLRNVDRDQTGMWFNRSRNIALSGVTIRYMHGFGILGQLSENLSFDRIVVAPGKESGRTCAAFADIFHFSMCKGLIAIRDSVMTGAQDDAVNVHGVHLQVADKPATNQILVRFGHSQTWGFQAFMPGDEITYVHRDTLQNFGDTRVTAVEMRSPHEQLLTLADPVPADVALQKDCVENITWTPSVEIRNCLVTLVPTRGFLLTSRRPMVIEGNRFIRIPMPALLVSDDAAGWYESGPVRDLLIRGNRFVECSEVMSVNPENSVFAGPVHRNIRFEDNTIAGAYTCRISAKSAEGLTIRGTQFKRNLKSKPSKGIVILDQRNCSQVRNEDMASSPAVSHEEQPGEKPSGRGTTPVTPSPKP